jgi:hypothetical protein
MSSLIDLLMTSFKREKVGGIIQGLSVWRESIQGDNDRLKKQRDLEVPTTPSNNKEAISLEE